MQPTSSVVWLEQHQPGRHRDLTSDGWRHANRESSMAAAQRVPNFVKGQSTGQASSSLDLNLIHQSALKRPEWGQAGVEVPLSQGSHSGWLNLPLRLFDAMSAIIRSPTRSEAHSVSARHIAVRPFVASATSGTSRSQLKRLCVVPYTVNGNPRQSMPESPGLTVLTPPPPLKTADPMIQELDFRLWHRLPRQSKRSSDHQPALSAANTRVQSFGSRNGSCEFARTLATSKCLALTAHMVACQAESLLTTTMAVANELSSLALWSASIASELLNVRPSIETLPPSELRDRSVTVMKLTVTPPPTAHFIPHPECCADGEEVGFINVAVSYQREPISKISFSLLFMFTT
ncbi:hypothetical protein CNYM01_12628 [Colletotrichum nymphaeae SA-01]|uniref:Uncharacterized protein n=1 Tax=Colletotrichum nymphaeae SA-01 TaxID=1460502 RepID=A0A135UKF9_9PEZI|nr:hypothetical protein CNYM01_12628 [Colletotrichum nymphaeae SA-01]